MMQMAQNFPKSFKAKQKICTTEYRIIPWERTRIRQATDPEKGFPAESPYSHGGRKNERGWKQPRKPRDLDRRGRADHF